MGSTNEVAHPAACFAQTTVDEVRALPNSPAGAARRIDGCTSSVRPGNITSMALARKKATTIALEPEMDLLLSRAAEERGLSRSEFIRQQLALVLEQYRRHPRPKVAGIIRRGLRERGDEGELYTQRRR